MKSIELAEGLTLPPEIVTDTVAILANRGGGKSTVAHRLVEQMYHAGLPVVVLDVKGDWWGIRSSADGAGPGLPFVIFGGDHADVPLEPTAGELLADLIVDDRVPAILDMSAMSKTKARAFTTAFAERLYQRNRDPLHVVIEEADVLIPQRASADTARLLGAMEDIAKRGRSRGLGLTLCSQRGQEVSKSILDLMETVVLLRMTGPRTIKAAQDWIRVNADDDTPAHDVIASLPHLQVGEAWVWSPGFLRILKRVHILKFETFDSHATPKPGQPRTVPKTRADINLAQLGADIAATAQRVLDNDPKTLHATINTLHTQLAAATARADDLTTQVATLTNTIATKDDTVAQLQNRIDHMQRPSEALQALTSAKCLITDAITALSATPTTAAAKAAPPTTPPTRRHRATTTPTAPVPDTAAPKFRSGAQRMLKALARMAPLHLTKTQWGLVAHMKHTGGTFNTYRAELQRAGLIEETHIGYTLTTAGFDYLGHQPNPMTGPELQQHYLSILRKGEARMLTALIDAHPAPLSRDDIAQKSAIAVTGGTFNTYLSGLVRNGLIDKHGDRYTASDILIHGAQPAN